MPDPAAQEQQLKLRAMRRLAIALALIAVAVVGLALLDRYHGGSEQAQTAKGPQNEPPAIAALPPPKPIAPPPASEEAVQRPLPPAPAVDETDTSLPAAADAQRTESAAGAKARAQSREAGTAAKAQLAAPALPATTRPERRLRHPARHVQQRRERAGPARAPQIPGRAGLPRDASGSRAVSRPRRSRCGAAQARGFRRGRGHCAAQVTTAVSSPRLRLS
jgi:hypothetical protein